MISAFLHLKRCVLGAVLVAFTLCGIAAVARGATAVNFLSATLPKTGAEPNDLPYRYLVPAGYNAANDYPLIVFLHGSGERGTNNTAQLGNNANGALQLVSTSNQAAYPCFMLAPQASLTEGWNANTLAQVIRTIQQLSLTYSIDPNRIYVTGLSMGGGGTWEIIQRYPTFFAAAVPMSGWGAGSYQKIVGLPIWNFHAANDGTVAVGGSDNAVAATRQAGGRVIYTRYATGGHSIWPTAYANPYLLPWMMAQHRNRPMAGVPLISITAPGGHLALPPATSTRNVSGTASVPGGVAQVNWTFTPWVGGAGVDSSTYALASGTDNWSVLNAPVAGNSTQFLAIATGSSWATGTGSATGGGITTLNDYFWNVPTGANLTPPTIALTSPTGAGSLTTAAISLALAGTAAPASGKTVQAVAWKNNRGGEGVCLGTTSWNIDHVDLQSGDNLLTITVRDSSSITASTTLAVYVTTGVVNTAPSFTTQPTSQAVTAGNFVTFTAAANGEPAPVFQWQKGGVNIINATHSSYTIANASPGDAGSYTVIATNLISSVTSSGAILTVNTAPIIFTQPVSQTVIAGNSVTFTVAANGSPAPTYQWQKGGVNISGATNSAYSIAGTSPGDAGSYSVIAANSVSSSTSNSALLTINTAPVITMQPVSQTIVSGNPITFTATASGNPAPTYQWQNGGVDISGATNSSYSIADVTPGDAGNFTVSVTNAVASIASNVASLTVYTAAVITTQPVNQAVANTTAAVFSVVASGNPAPSYQWRKEGIDISGATSSSYSIVAATLSDAGNYSVVVTNAVNSVTSANVTLAVNLVWQLAGTGDFDGDGKVDLLWRKTTTGAVELWLMNGTAISSAAAIATVAADWQIAGTGDFNADGQIDILWRKVSTGAVAVWYMNGTTISSTAVLATVAADWQIAGTGDFNADGKVDVLWRKTSTGAVAVWYMNGAAISSTAVIATVAADWQIAGTGDFDNDGKVDILWRKTSTGAVAIWLMNGATIASTTVIATVASDWQIAGTGDCNADTKVDILWRKKSTGSVAVWLMNGVAISSTQVIGTVP